MFEYHKAITSYVIRSTMKLILFLSFMGTQQNKFKISKQIRNQMEKYCSGRKLINCLLAADFFPLCFFQIHNNTRSPTIHSSVFTKYSFSSEWWKNTSELLCIRNTQKGHVFHCYYSVQDSRLCWRKNSSLLHLGWSSKRNSVWYFPWRKEIFRHLVLSCFLFPHQCNLPSTPSKTKPLVS